MMVMTVGGGGGDDHCSYGVDCYGDSDSDNDTKKMVSVVCLKKE
jgi:hypothetical protein